jgi:hypothetical protein
MFSNFIKQKSQKSPAQTRFQCFQTVTERRLIFCDWGFHGRGSNDGWVLTYVDEIDLDGEEDLRHYTRTSPKECGEALSKFAKSQLKKNKNIKQTNGWVFKCIIEDGKQKALPLNRRDRTPRTKLLFERELPCPCQGREHPFDIGGLCKAEKRGVEDVRNSFDSFDPPPQYRRRPSTMATVFEHDDAPMYQKT